MLRGTTGEFRLLELTGLINANGALAAGTRIETGAGEIAADGTAAYTITTAGASSNLAGRLRLEPPNSDMPQVVYLGQETGEAELLEALENGTIDAVARGEIGNRDASYASNSAFVVVALDEATEQGGFSLAVENADLADCIDEKINYLTDGQHVGYGEWRANPAIFAERAQQWNP